MAGYVSAPNVEFENSLRFLGFLGHMPPLWRWQHPSEIGGAQSDIQTTARCSTRKRRLLALERRKSSEKYGLQGAGGELRPFDSTFTQNFKFGTVVGPLR
jgi:hypothetical protein